MGRRTAPAAVLPAYYHAQRYINHPETTLREAAGRGGHQAAALTGALLRAQFGETAWPTVWQATLYLGSIVVDVANDLHNGLKCSMFTSDEGWWQRYLGW